MSHSFVCYRKYLKTKPRLKSLILAKIENGRELNRSCGESSWGTWTAQFLLPTLPASMDCKQGTCCALFIDGGVLGEFFSQVRATFIGSALSACIVVSAAVTYI